MKIESNTKFFEALQSCISACYSCSAASLEEEDVKMMKHCIGLDLDCAGICTLVVSFTARGSVHAKHLLKECVEICKACAEECEKHASMGMEHCNICAKACRNCIAACEAEMN